MEVSFTIQNVGNSATVVPTWNDWVLLSQDPTLTFFGFVNSLSDTLITTWPSPSRRAAMPMRGSGTLTTAVCDLWPAPSTASPVSAPKRVVFPERAKPTNPKKRNGYWWTADRFLAKLDDAELAAIVKRAHRHGLKVAAHALADDDAAEPYDAAFAGRHVSPQIAVVLFAIRGWHQVADVAADGPEALGVALAVERGHGAGGLGEAWNWPHEGVSEVANDLNGYLVNFYRVLKDPKKFRELQRTLSATPFSRLEWEDADATMQRLMAKVKPEAFDLKRPDVKMAALDRKSVV